MTDISWVITLGGSIGGALNAVLSDRSPVLPSVVKLSPGHTRVLRVGVAGIDLNAEGGSGLFLLGLCDSFVAFVSARWATNEVDKLVLRKAVFKAASAPAAHPDLVGEMELAPPYMLYTLVDRLLPRRAGHR
jgi:hypothetical protein